MVEIETIQQIKDLKNQIKQKIPEISTSTYDDQSFGVEDEYTYKGLLGGFDGLLTDLTSLTKTPNQFLKLSTYEERVIIKNILDNALSNLQDPNNLYDALNQLKQDLRPFHIRYTQERLIDFDEELSELTKNKLSFSINLAGLKEDLNDVAVKKEGFNEILENLQQQKEKLINNLNDSQTKLSELHDSINTATNYTNSITKIKTQADSSNAVIDNFVKKISEREKQLEDQKVRTNSYKSQLEDFSQQQKESLMQAKNLIEQATTALGYKKAEGISAAFKTQLDEAKQGKVWFWLAGAVAFIACATGLGVWFILKDPIFSFTTVLARYSIVAMPIAAAWFCAGQYTKLKNIIEDYAYKTMLTQSIIGFSEQLKMKMIQIPVI